jgi:hypothetical protein
MGDFSDKLCRVGRIHSKLQKFFVFCPEKIDKTRLWNDNDGMTRFATKDRKYFLHAAHRQVGVARFSQMQRGGFNSVSPETIDVFLSPFEEYLAQRLIDRLQTDYPEENWRFRTVCKFEWNEADPMDKSDCALLLCGEGPFSPKFLDRLRNYSKCGGTIIAINAGAEKTPEWREFAGEILGTSFEDAYPLPSKLSLRIAAGHHFHPVVRDVFAWIHHEPTSISILNDQVSPLIEGVYNQKTCPVAWLIDDGFCKVFATTLGSSHDFLHRSFYRLIHNALLWGLG